jgi:hypothetical protein
MVRGLCIAALLSCSFAELRAQGNAEIAAAVLTYLNAATEAEAATKLESCLALTDADGAATLKVLHSAPADSAMPTELRVPYRDQELVTTIRAPKDHDRSKARLPVVFDISGGGVLAHLSFEGAIVASVPGYTPPEFSDEGRDGFLKVARSVAMAAHGDLNRIWLTGFSWAGHASYDTALHRPGAVRGIVPLGGGPRHVHFRLLPNLRSTTTLAFVGASDDPILIWNLKEVDRLKGELKLHHQLGIDPEMGHSLPLRSMDAASAEVIKLAANEPWFSATGTLIADGPLVENALFRIDEVDAARVDTKEPIPVPAQLNIDAQRREKLKILAKRVVKLSWKLETAKDGGKTLTLDSDGVRGASVFLRPPLFAPNDRVTIKAKSKVVWSGAVAIDRKALLTDARRTGHWLCAALKEISVRF